MKIIGFGHKKRVGKDRATQFAMSFARQYRPDLKINVLSFGDEIKRICEMMYRWGGLEDAVYYENYPEEIEVILPLIGKSPRQIWDTVGLMGREISDKTWVELALQNQDADLLICKDIRGLTEHALIRRTGGIAVKMHRMDAPKGGPVDEILNDAQWDHEIFNNDGLRELNLTVKNIVKEYIDATFPRRA